MLKVLLTTLFSFNFIATFGQSLPIDSNAKTPISFVAYESLPKYPGGTENLYKMISTNIQYPKDAFRQGIEGVVVVSFVVEKDGTIKDFEIIKSVEKSLDKEALRVLTLMEKWEPGYQNNKPIRVKYSLPIAFSVTKKKV